MVVMVAELPHFLEDFCSSALNERFILAKRGEALWFKESSSSSSSMNLWGSADWMRLLKTSGHLNSSLRASESEKELYWSKFRALWLPFKKWDKPKLKFMSDVFYTNGCRLGRRWKSGACDGLKPEEGTSFQANTTCRCLFWFLLRERFPYLCVAVKDMTLLALSPLTFVDVMFVVTVRSRSHRVIFNTCLSGKRLVAIWDFDVLCRCLSTTQVYWDVFFLTCILMHWGASHLLNWGIRCGI